MRWINRHLEEGLCIALLSVMCLVVVLQVFFRLVLRDPLAWTEELATILFVWVVMIGASLALKHRDHFAVELLHRRLRPADRRLARRLVGAMLILFSALLVYEGGRLTILNVSVWTPAMELPRALVYSAIPAGGLMMLWRSIQLLRAAGHDEAERGDPPRAEAAP